MKKMIISALILMSWASSTLACEGEAQLKAPVQAVQMTRSGACLARVETSKTEFYASSSVCPLDLVEIQNEGVEIKLGSAQQCQLNEIQEINGLVYRDSSGHLVLE